MRLGIDWVATIVLVAAYLFSQVRAVPPRWRHIAFAGACFFIAAWRLRLGAAGVNLVFVGLALALGLGYTVRAIRVRQQGE